MNIRLILVRRMLRIAVGFIWLALGVATAQPSAKALGRLIATSFLLRHSVGWRSDESAFPTCL
jgi:hypothetical protein